jgi:hypothetical protein
MLVYDESLEKDLTAALQLSYCLQEKNAIDKNQLLEKQLEYLSMYANYDHIDNCIVILFPDFAPSSFAISWYARGKDAYPQTTLDNIQNLITRRTRYSDSVSEVLESYGYKFWFNGGLIYHGTHDGGGDGGAPTFSVNLSPVNGWSVHT